MNPALTYAKRAVDTIERRYNQLIRLDTDKEEAIDEAVAHAYPRRSEDAQADIVATIAHIFDEYPSGITRKMAMTTALRNYEIARIRG